MNCADRVHRQLVTLYRSHENVFLMKEFDLEDMMPIEAVKSKIWKIFDILRSENITAGDYYIVLFLLSLFKDKFVPSENLSYNTNIKHQIEAVLQKKKSETSPKYLEIYESLEPALKNISQYGIVSIIHILYSLDHKTLSNYFPEIFDSVLYRIAQSHGRHGGEFIQPSEITRLICGLTNLPENAKVFNPFAGLASFGVNLDKGQDYFGQEINQKTWALGALRIMANERPGSSRYVCDDSILHWPNETEKFDLIVSNPPYGLRLSSQHIDIDSGIRTVEQFLIEKGLHSLNDEGKLIALLPQGFLFRGMHHEQQLRQFLIDEDLLDTIISLPGGLLLNTGIQLIILVIDKKKKLPGKVRFIKADKFVVSKSPREKILDDYALNALIHGNIQDADVIRIVDIQKIKEWDYNLNVPRYFQKAIVPEKNEQLVKLKDILEYVRGQRRNLPKSGKHIRIRDLKDDKVDFQLDVSGIENMELRRPDISKISESCLLLATRWRTLKPTLFKHDGEPIFISQDILSFKVNEFIADYAYLINELNADYVKEQLESYRMGATVPFIRRDDLLEIVIKLPALELQRKKVDLLYQENLIGEKDKIAEIRKILNEELGLKQHNIRQHLKNVKDSFDVLIDFMNKNDGILKKDDIINPTRKVTVNKRIKSLYSSLESVILEINNLTNEQSYGLAKPINIIEAITKSINDIARSNFDIIFTKDDAAIQLTDLENIEVSFSENDLKEIINNVVENAERHGFIDKLKRHQILFDISVDDNKLVFLIKNNGRPYPKNIIKSFGIKGVKAGGAANQGLGVWKIIQTIQHFGHDYEIIDEPEREFPAGWIFKFKIINE